MEALTFQDTYTYREVYPDGSAVDLKAKKELNAFLLVADESQLTKGIDSDLLLGKAQIRWILGLVRTLA